MHDGAPVYVTVFGRWSVQLGLDAERHLSAARRRLLGALVAAGEPLSRPALTRCAGLKRTSCNSTLTKLSADLGLAEGVHRVNGVKSVELNRSVVASDVDEVRAILAAGRLDRAGAERFARLQVMSPVVDLGLSPDDPLARSLQCGLADLRREALRQLAWFDLGPEGRGDPILADHEVDDGDPFEVLLVRCHQVAAAGNPVAARKLLRGAGDVVLADVVTADGTTVPGALLAHVIIDTAAVDTGESGTTGAEDCPGDDGTAAGGGPIDVEAVLGALTAGTGGRVVLVPATAGDQAVAGLISDLRRHWPHCLGAQVDDTRSAAAGLARIMRPALAAQVRSEAAGVSADLLRATLAIDRDEPLLPLSSLGAYCAELHALHDAWCGSVQPAASGGAEQLRPLVVGRRSAVSPDLDRALANLLRLDPLIRLVVVHGDRPGLRPPGLATFGSTDITSPGLVGTGDGERSRHDPGIGPTPRIERDRASIGRPPVLAVISFATTPEGLIVPDLADELLELAGIDSTVQQLADDAGPIRASTTGHCRLDGDPDQLAGGVTGNEQARLAGHALSWLAEGHHLGADETELLGRLVRLLPDGTSARAAWWQLRTAALRRAGHGDHDRAATILQRALGLQLSADEEADLLHLRANSLRELGRWSEALDDYRRAADLLAPLPSAIERLVETLLGMARVTWGPQIGSEVDDRLRAARPRLPRDESVLRARIDLCLAGGTFQDGGSGIDRVDQAVIIRSMRTVRRSTDPAARGWGIVHGRKALLGVLPVERSVSLAEEIIAHAGPDIALRAHGHQALYVDRIRQGSWDEARACLEEIERLVCTPVSAEQTFSAHVARTCWDLAVGRTDDAAAGLSLEEGYFDRLGGSTWAQVTLAHAAWLARQQRDRGAIGRFAKAAAAMAEQEPGGAIWAAGSALLWLDLGRLSEAAGAILGFVRRSGGVAGVLRGPHRLPVLAVVAWVAGLIQRSQPELGARITTGELGTVADALDAADDRVVLIGWPTVVLGPTDRFRALARLALGDTDTARHQLALAASCDRPMQALHADTLEIERLLES